MPNGVNGRKERLVFDDIKPGVNLAFIFSSFARTMSELRKDEYHQ